MIFAPGVLSGSMAPTSGRMSVGAKSPLTGGIKEANSVYLFLAGMFVAAFVSIPLINLATPIFGMAFMVHVHKKLSGARTELVQQPR